MGRLMNKRICAQLGILPAARLSFMLPSMLNVVAQLSGHLCLCFLQGEDPPVPFVRDLKARNELFNL